MTINNYVEQAFPVQCKGRDNKGNEVLEEAIEVTITVYKGSGSNTLSSSVNCPYNTGGHGQRCNASNPEINKVRKGVVCPYAFDLPYALEKKK